MGDTNALANGTLTDSPLRSLNVRKRDRKRIEQKQHGGIDRVSPMVKLASLADKTWKLMAQK